MPADGHARARPGAQCVCARTPLRLMRVRGAAYLDEAADVPARLPIQDLGRLQVTLVRGCVGSDVVLGAFDAREHACRRRVPYLERGGVAVVAQVWLGERAFVPMDGFVLGWVPDAVASRCDTHESGRGRSGQHSVVGPCLHSLPTHAALVDVRRLSEAGRTRSGGGVEQGRGKRHPPLHRVRCVDSREIVD